MYEKLNQLKLISISKRNQNDINRVMNFISIDKYKCNTKTVKTNK